MRIQPAQLGCGEPYYARYVARVLIESPEGKAVLEKFMARYQSVSLALYRLVRRLYANPKNHLALYALLLPAHVPEEIRRTWFWAENITGDPLDLKSQFDLPGRKWGDPGRPEVDGKTWSELNQNSTCQLLSVLANPNCEPPAARPARVWQQMLKEYGLRCYGLQPNSIEWIFRHVPQHETRVQIAESVAGLVRGFLSSLELRKKKTIQRRQTLDSLQTAHPGFFAELKAYLEDLRAWQTASRRLESLRKARLQELQAKGLPDESIQRLLWAVQRAAMRSEAHQIAALRQIYPPTAEENLLASEYAELVAEFSAALSSGTNDPMEGGAFRRLFSASAPPINLAADVPFLERIITFYDRHVACLSDALRSLLAERRSSGERVYHRGWERLCRAGALPEGVDPPSQTREARKLYNFIVTDLRAYLQCLRPVQEPDWPQQPAFWPGFREGKDWQRLQKRASDPGNTMRVIVKVPRGRLRKLRVSMSLRGNLPVTAKDIDSLDIATGLQRFVANQELWRVARHETKKTFLKLQSLRFVKNGERIAAHLSAVHMTQLLAASPLSRGRPTDIQAGERIAVMHLYPGGTRLAHLVMFERTCDFPGWKNIRIEEIVRDTRSQSYEHATGKRVHIRTQRKTTAGFVALDETAHLVRRAGLENLYRQAPATLEKPLSATARSARTNLSATHYNQLAARVALLCQYNHVGHLLLAGAGSVVANIRPQEGSPPLRLVAPSRQFITVHQSGRQLQLHGFLVSALRRSGVIPILTSARARNVWVKPFLHAGKLEGCTLAQPYHENSQAKTRVYAGLRTLIAPTPDHPGYSYPLNACWAIVLDWSHPDFKAHVDALLQRCA